MRKKCIVLDLDNTLWGGVIGEDGIENMQLSLSGPGASFLAFQQALRDLAGQGIILAINSHNNEEEAFAVIRHHPNMVLKEPDFAAYRMNWKNKVENMRELAQELNIGLDSMVFLDDSPLQRENMRQFLPEVETPELPSDPREYVLFLQKVPYFDGDATTDEDRMRGNLYVTERLRRAAENEIPDRAAFLESLNLRLAIEENDQSVLPRLAQLSEKTNQFNMRKRPLSEGELARYMTDPEYTVLHARVLDRYGDYGITAFALVRKGRAGWHIESFLLSCRVLDRGVEDAFLAAIGARAKAAGASELSIEFEPNERNAPAQRFVERVFAEGTVPIDSLSTPAWVPYDHEIIQ